MRNALVDEVFADIAPFGVPPFGVRQFIAAFPFESLAAIDCGVRLKGKRR